MTSTNLLPSHYFIRHGHGFEFWAAYLKKKGPSDTRIGLSVSERDARVSGVIGYGGLGAPGKGWF